jgi:SAM-dependent methyltransferase
VKPGSSVQQLYAKRASFYDHLFIDFLGWGKELGTFFQKSDYLHPNTKILDAGCGTGIVTRVLYQLAKDNGYQDVTFHAFDLTEKMLSVFQQWIAVHEATTIELLQADVLELGALPPHWGGYGTIVSSTMLEYLPREKLLAAMDNLKHLLKSEGTLLIFMTRRNLLTRWLAGKWWKTQVYAESEIHSILHQLGFKVIKPRQLAPGWSSSIMVIEARLDF